MITGVATSAFAVKRALLGAGSRLKAEADGGLLDGWDIDYAYRGDAGSRSIYGGGWRLLEQEQAVAEGIGLVVREVVEVSLYITYKLSPKGDVEETDAVVEDVSGVVTRIFAANPNLGGDMTWLGISRGQGDYSNDLETISRAALALRVQSYVSWVP